MSSSSCWPSCSWPVGVSACWWGGGLVPAGWEHLVRCFSRARFRWQRSPNVVAAPSMANHPLPTDTEMAALTDLPAIVRWCALDQAVWREINNAFGQFPNIRLLAHAPPEGIATALEHMELRRVGADGALLDPPTRPLTMVEMVQTALVWRVCRKCFGLEDIDILAPGVVEDYQHPPQRQ